MYTERTSAAVTVVLFVAATIRPESDFGFGRRDCWLSVVCCHCLNVTSGYENDSDGGRKDDVDCVVIVSAYQGSRLTSAATPFYS